jgi:hypothetical protein
VVILAGGSTGRFLSFRFLFYLCLMKRLIRLLFYEPKDGVDTFHQSTKQRVLWSSIRKYLHRSHLAAELYTVDAARLVLGGTAQS